MKTLHVLAAVIILCGMSCLPPDNQPAADSTVTFSADEQVGAATPDGTGCHYGTFECATGPEVASCGSWMFDVNETGAISGTGSITTVTGEQLAIILGGVVDPGVGTYVVELSTAEGGAGHIDLSYDGGSLNLTGTWWFRDGPEPTGNEIEGGVTGSSCIQLQ